MAPETGFCLGCLRSGMEIAEWSGADESRRREILECVGTRHAAGFRIVKSKKVETIS